jgi:hypothetical protein
VTNESENLIEAQNMANSNAVTFQLPKYCNKKLFAGTKPILLFRILLPLDSQFVAGTNRPCRGKVS